MSEIATVPAAHVRHALEPAMDSAVIGSHGPEFIKQLQCDARRQARADYGFVATDHEYRTTKHFLSVKKGVSEVQQYVADNPEQGIPRLYWMNFFRPVYVDHFGRQKLTSLGDLANVVFLDDGGVFIRFGRLPEDSHAPAALDHQRAVIRTLGDEAFFDLRDPNRTLDVPAALR
jgi:hypothetical protein